MHLGLLKYLINHRFQSRVLKLISYQYIITWKTRPIYAFDASCYCHESENAHSTLIILHQTLFKVSASKLYSTLISTRLELDFRTCLDAIIFMNKFFWRARLTALSKLNERKKMTSWYPLNCNFRLFLKVQFWPKI